MLYYLYILLTPFGVPICTYISSLRLGMSLDKTAICCQKKNYYFNTMSFYENFLMLKGEWTIPRIFPP